MRQSEYMAESGPPVSGPSAGRMRAPAGQSGGCQTYLAVLQYVTDVLVPLARNPARRALQAQVAGMCRESRRPRYRAPGAVRVPWPVPGGPGAGCRRMSVMERKGPPSNDRRGRLELAW